MKEAPGPSETSVFKRATRRNIPEDTILHKLYEFVIHVRWSPHITTAGSLLGLRMEGRPRAMEGSCAYIE
jgi:hypothetical protein